MQLQSRVTNILSKPAAEWQVIAAEPADPASLFTEYAAPLAAIPAIVFGHAARRQIKHSGEQGAGLALAGLIFGWAAVILGVLLVLGVAMSVGMHGSTMH